MRRTTSITLRRAAATLGAASLLALGAPAIPAGAGIAVPPRILGTVTEDGTGTRLEGMSVRLIDASTGTLLAVDVTDVDGRYTFDKIAPGQYLVRFIDLDGNHHAEYHDDVAAKASATAVTPFGDTFIDASLATAATGMIRGTVTEDGTGTPLPGISVRLLTTGGALLATRATQADGTYDFGQRDHGSYLVRYIDADASHISEFHIDAAARTGATPVNHAAWITTVDDGLAVAIAG